jgi:L-Ala-D/L-Glu epimerase
VTDTIDRVEVFCVHLPYKAMVHYATNSDDKGVFAILRLTTKDGAVGIAECMTRIDQPMGEDIKTVAYQIETHFKGLLVGMDPLAIDAITYKISKINKCRTAKALIDIALWDIKGKLLGQPVWRLLGGDKPKPVPVSSIVFGHTTVKAMAEDAAKAVATEGFRGFKVKTWKRSMEDVEVFKALRQAVGNDVFLYADANSSYTPGEAKRIFPHFADHNVRMVEDPCRFSTPADLAGVAAALPIPVLGDGCWETVTDVYNLVKIDAIGALSLKLRKTGITRALKLIALCEMAGVNVVLGTNTETRLGTLPMVHVWSAFKSLQSIPTEAGFYRFFVEDVSAGDVRFDNGTIHVPDVPGFGATIDESKLKKYRV